MTLTEMAVIMTGHFHLLTGSAKLEQCSDLQTMNQQAGLARCSDSTWLLGTTWTALT